MLQEQVSQKYRVGDKISTVGNPAVRYVPSLQSKAKLSVEPKPPGARGEPLVYGEWILPGWMNTLIGANVRITFEANILNNLTSQGVHNASIDGLKLLEVNVADVVTGAVISSGLFTNRRDMDQAVVRMVITGVLRAITAPIKWRCSLSTKWVSGPGDIIMTWAWSVDCSANDILPAAPQASDDEFEVVGLEDCE